MCRPETILNRCSFVGTKGLCNRPCYRAVCYVHTKRTSLPLCTHCGARGTTSKTGICAAIATKCRWRSQVRLHQMQAADAQLEAYVQELIETFDPECQSLTTGASGARPVTSTTAPITAGGT